MCELYDEKLRVVSGWNKPPEAWSDVGVRPNKVIIYVLYIVLYSNYLSAHRMKSEL